MLKISLQNDSSGVCEDSSELFFVCVKCVQKLQRGIPLFFSRFPLFFLPPPTQEKELTTVLKQLTTVLSLPRAAYYTY